MRKESLSLSLDSKIKTSYTLCRENFYLAEQGQERERERERENNRDIRVYRLARLTRNYFFPFRRHCHRGSRATGNHTLASSFIPSRSAASRSRRKCATLLSLFLSLSWLPFPLHPYTLPISFSFHLSATSLNFSSWRPEPALGFQ